MEAVFRKHADSTAGHFVIEVAIEEKNLTGELIFDLGTDGHWHRADMHWHYGNGELSKEDRPYARAARAKIADLFEVNPGTADGSVDLTDGDIIAARILLDRESVY